MASCYLNIIKCSNCNDKYALLIYSNIDSAEIDFCCSKCKERIKYPYNRDKNNIPVSYAVFNNEDIIEVTENYMIITLNKEPVVKEEKVKYTESQLYKLINESNHLKYKF